MNLDIPETQHFWGKQFPVGGITLLYGPTSSGKSQLLWQLLQAVQSGTELFNQPVPQANSMLFCLDMPKVSLFNRWKDQKFNPGFHIMLADMINVTHPGFLASRDFKTMKEAMLDNQIQLLAVDASGEIHASSVNQDENVVKVYNFFKAQFPGVSCIFNHHDRKQQTDQFGNPRARSAEDALGSGNWRNFATSSSHLYPVSPWIRRLDHTKSQVARLEEPTLLLQLHDGSLVPWTEDSWNRLGAEFESVVIRLGLTIHSEGDIDLALPKIKETIPMYQSEEIKADYFKRLFACYQIMKGARMKG